MVAQLGRALKTPSDRKRYSVDYTDWLDTGELVVSAAIVVDPPAGTLLVDGVVVSGDGKSVVFFLSDGDDGETYRALITVQTSGGQSKEDFVTVLVRDPQGVVQ